MGDQNHKFYVIGAGLPRTGTLSLKVALEKLLPGKCMHMKSVMAGNITEVLDDVLDLKTSTDQSFKDYFSRHNIVAGVDVPFLFHYKRAMFLYPDAKVVLTVREPSGWVKSMRQTLYLVNKDLSLFEKFLAFFVHFVMPRMKRFDAYLKNEKVFVGAIESVGDDTWEEFFEKWVEDVKCTVPPERLLIFSVKEGWEPLCKFLDLPIPNEPFPHVNDSKEFNESKNFIKKLAIGGLVITTVASVCIGCTIAYAYKHITIEKVQDWLTKSLLMLKW